MLFLLRPDPDTGVDPYGCSCGASGLDSCVSTDTCVAHPDAECDPVKGFRCSGFVEFSADDGCAPGFADDNVTCRGRLPRGCAFDSDCPVGAYCSTTRGGVCWWDCLIDCTAHPEACCESGFSCGCDGRCHDDDGEVGAPSPRPMLDVTPSTLRFESGDDESILTEARRLVVTARPPAGSYEPQEVQVVADRGVKVACQSTAYADKPTDSSAYYQSCALTFDGSGSGAQGVWVLPTSLETPVSSDGPPHRWHVELRAGAEANLVTRDVLVVFATAAPITPPTSGEYAGTVYFERAWLASHVIGSTAVGADGLPVAGRIAVPVTATVDIRSDATEVTLYDTTRTFSPAGVISLSFPGELADGPPVTTPGQPLLLGRWADWDQAERSLGFNGLTDDGTTVGFLSASTERQELSGRFGLIATELNDDLAPALACSFILQKTSDRVVAPPEPELLGPLEATPEIALAHGVAALLEPGGLSWAEWIRLLGEASNVASCLLEREFHYTAWGQDFREACESYLAPAALIPPEQAFEFCVDIFEVALDEPSLPGTSNLVGEFFVPCCVSGCSTDPQLPKANCADAATICNKPTNGVVVDSSQIPGASWQGVINVKFCNIDSALYFNGGNTTNGADRFAARSDQCGHRMFGFDATATSELHVTSTDTLFAAPNDDYKLGGFTRNPGMPNSGDLELTISAGAGPRVPVTFDFSYQEDRRDLAGAESVLTASEMFRACLDDLNRGFPEWVWTPPTLSAAVGSDINARLAELFRSNGCLSMAGFVLSIDWMADAGGNDRLFARRLQQWLDVHTFVARYGYQESEAVESLLGVENESGDAPALAEGAEWGEVLDTVESGWSLILHPRIYARILAVAGESWLDPDYRRDWLAEDEPILDGEFPYLQEGLPVALLDASAAQLSLVAHYMRAQQGAVATSKDAVAFRDAVLARYGQAFRTSLLVEATANSIFAAAHESAGPAVSVPWLEAWSQAREALTAARQDAQAAASSAARLANPLGIEDVDLPLYFVDPQGVNSKFFASSDYLLTNWAKPAVQEALASLDGARSAWLSQRDSVIREKMNESDNARRIEELKRRYGSALVSACGLEIREEEALEAFSSGEYNLASCFVARGAESAICRSRLEEAARLVADPDGECESDDGDAEKRVVDTKRALCVVAREYAFKAVGGDGDTLFDTLDYVETYIDSRPDYADKAAAIAAYRDVVRQIAYEIGSSPITGGSLTAVYEKAACPDYMSEPAPNAGGGGFNQGYDSTSVCMSIETPTTWEMLDAVSVGDCGRTLLVDGVRPAFLPASADDQEMIQSAVFLLRQQFQGWDKDDDAFCDTYLEIAADIAGITRDLISPDGLAQCLRGDLGVFHITLLKAREQVRMAKVQLTALVDKYDAAMGHCLAIREINQESEVATDRHLRAMESLRQAQESASTLFGAVSFLTSVASSFVNPSGAPGAIQSGIGLASSISGQGLAAAAADFQRRHTQTMEKLENQKELSACLLSAQNYESEVATHVESIQLALLSLAEAMVQKSTLDAQLANLIREGTAAVEREEARAVLSPSFHYWLDERVDVYKSDFAWAQRLTYLALRAIEYEAQATLPIRSQILLAKNPIALDEAVREMEREQLTRSIAGSRPEEKSIVLSLTDELLRVGDRTSAQSGELSLTPTEGLQRQLLDKANAVFDQRGEYLGQGIRFTLEPQGPLHYRCAERLWSLAATVQGDLIGRVAPSLPLFVLKRNTFRSQWCGYRSAADGPFQTVSLRPSSDLMRPGTQTGDNRETEADSWAYVDAWVNVSRSDFYRDAYAEGGSDELAGRGLYGDYMLLLPWHGLLDSEIRIEQIEDILIRFDYLSVSNGANMSDKPPGLGEFPPAPRFAVDQLELIPGANRMYVSWRNPTFPGLDSVIVRRSTGDYPGTPEMGELIAAIECYAGECDPFVEVTDGGLTTGVPVFYAAFTIDEYGDAVSTLEFATPSAAPSVMNLVATGVPGSVDVSWTNPSFDGFVKVVVVRKQGGIPANDEDGTVIYDGSGESWSDTTATVAVEYYYRAFGVDDFDVITPGAYDMGSWTTPPVTNVSAVSTGPGSVQITWDDSMPGLDVKVLRTDTGIPPTHDADGTLVYDGPSSEYDVDSVPANTVYHYAVFACYAGTCSTTGPSDSASWYQVIDDFESGLGNWSQNIAQDDFNWTRTDSATPSANTGPSGAADSTTWYLFTEATGNLSNKEAIIRGPAIDMSNRADGSIEFYWHMYGEDTGSLYLDVSDDGTCDSNLFGLWDEAGDQGDAWQVAAPSLAPGSGDDMFYVCFRGVTASGDTSDIAIDQVKISLWGEL